MEEVCQNNLINRKEQSHYLLQSGKLIDCRFLVGTSSNQRIIYGDRFLLALSSPVFERMFFGSLPEKSDPIGIPDVQPNAFQAMLKYIYTEEISISSCDIAYELYYLAKKYMLPHLERYCSNFLLGHLSPKNVCHTYECAKLFDDSRLIESSMKHISNNTLEVIADPSFMDIEVSTLMDILDQDTLNIDSELNLFDCLLRFANEYGILNDAASKNASDFVVEKIKLVPDDSNSGAASTSIGTCGSVPNVADEVVVVDSDTSASGNVGESAANIINIMDAQSTTMNEATLRQAVKKIRFLTMAPKQFAEGPARSKLLQQYEAFVILTKISNPKNNDCPMPEGFSQSSKRRRV